MLSYLDTYVELPSTSHLIDNIQDDLHMLYVSLRIPNHQIFIKKYQILHKNWKTRLKSLKPDPLNNQHIQ